MGWRGDMNDMRDMSVTNLLKSVMERTKEQTVQMDLVSNVINKMQRIFLTMQDRDTIMKMISVIMDEKVVLMAAIVTAGDKTAMMYLISKANQLTNQLIRPKPRVLRTKQLFNEFRKAWRYAVGMHMSMWEETIQANTISIIRDIPIVKPSSTTATQSFVQRIKNAMIGGSTLDDDQKQKLPQENSAT